MGKKQDLGHNYQRKIDRLIRQGKMMSVTGTHKLEVKHDDHCGVFGGGRCNCNPDIYLNGSLVE